MNLGAFSEFSKEFVLPYWLSNTTAFLLDRFYQVNLVVFRILSMTLPIAQQYQPLIRFTRPIEFNQ
jgi:hypothetical protein